MNILRYQNFVACLRYLLISIIPIIYGCTGSSSDDTASLTCTGSGIATASYTINWDPMSDNSNLITGFKVYFGTDSLITKQNAIDSYSVSGTAAQNSWLFTPSDFGLQKCTTYNFAVASLGSFDESQLSNSISILIE